MKSTKIRVENEATRSEAMNRQ